MCIANQTTVHYNWYFSGGINRKTLGWNRWRKGSITFAKNRQTNSRTYAILHFWWPSWILVQAVCVFHLCWFTQAYLAIANTVWLSLLLSPWITFSPTSGLPRKLNFGPGGLHAPNEVALQCVAGHCYYQLSLFFVPSVFCSWPTSGKLPCAK